MILQASQNEYDLDGDDDDDDDHFNDDNGDGDDEHDGSLSGSDDNEKGSWSGSNNGNDSINGDTSGDGTASTASNNSGSHNAPSSSGSSRSHNSSGSGSGSGSDSPTPKHPTMDWGKAEQTPCIFNYGSKTSGGFKPNVVVTGNNTSQLGVAYQPRAAGSKKSQSVESYNHGGVVAVNEEANAVEKATYLGYSQQQTQDKRIQAVTAAPACPASATAPVPATTLSSSSSQEISATLASAEYYQGAVRREQTLSSGWHYPPLRPIPSSVAIPQHCMAKVPNILLSVIPQGILAPRSAGGVSPIGSSSPDETRQGWELASAPMPAPSNPINTSSNYSTFGGLADNTQRLPVFTRDSGSFRNLPSSNIANANSPL